MIAASQWSGEAVRGRDSAVYPSALSKGFIVGRIVSTPAGWFVEPLARSKESR